MRLLPAMTMILTASAVLPVAARAQSAEAGANTRDLRCLLTLSALAADEKVRPLALNGVYYFAGRITATSPRLDFSTALRAEAEKMRKADFAIELQRCSTILNAVEEQLKGAQTSLKGFVPKD